VLSSDHILRTANGFRAAKALLSAVERGLFTELGKGPRTGAQLQRTLGLGEPAAHELLDALVGLHLLEREGAGPEAIYVNSRESGYFLDRNSPAYLHRELEAARRALGT
jgi:hypothetical protein